MSKLKTECAFCEKEIELYPEDMKGEPRCDDCQKLIDEDKEGEIV